MWSYRNVAAMVLSLVAHIATAGELATYRFTDSIPAFRSWCFECDGPYHTTRARVEGTFSIELDRSNQTGKLLTLDVRLSEDEGLNGLAEQGEGAEWHAVGDSYHRTFLDEAPLSRPALGVLWSPEYRPLGPETLADSHRDQLQSMPSSDTANQLRSWQHGGVGWDHAPHDAMLLSDKSQTRYGALWSVYLEGDHARLSYLNLQSDDYIESLTAVAAVRVPSPGGYCLAVIAMGFIIISRKR